MLHALINFLLNRKGQPAKQDTPAVDTTPQAPYKLEPPEPVTQAEVKSGGDWPFPKPAEKPAAEPKAKKPRAKKPAAPKAPAAMTAAKKPRAKKAPAAK